MVPVVNVQWSRSGGRLVSRFFAMNSKIFKQQRRLTRLLRLARLFTLFLVCSVHCLASMSWHMESSNKKYQCILGFKETKDKTEVFLTCNKNLYNDLGRETKKLFHYVPFSWLKYEFTYAEAAKEPRQPVNKDLSGVKHNTPVPDAKKLVVGEGTPQMMSAEQLVEILANRHVLFYTGAGISASVVPAMAQLEPDLGLTEDLYRTEGLKQYVERATRNPRQLLRIMAQFQDRCANAEPTEAHRILAKISQERHFTLVTENLDQLHQKTGMNPILACLNRYQSNSALKDELLKLDVIVTVGLNSDESGFLAYALLINPKIRIISLNLVKTNYLSNNDYWVKGDIQSVFREVDAVWKE